MKMRFILLLFFTLTWTITFSQTSYYNGFNQGYQSGYCYQDYGCVSPIPPVPPVPSVGESHNSYQDGYNRGFQMGRDDKNKMSSRTRNPSNTSAPSIPNYGYELPFGELLNALAQKQAIYDYNFDYIQSLLDWIGELKRQSDDRMFLADLNEVQNTLLSFEDKDLSLLSNDIKTIERQLRRAVEEYNVRVADKDDPNTYWKFGIEKIKHQDYNEAIKDFTKVIALSPYYYPAYLNRGFCYYQQDKWLEAENDFTKFINSGDTSKLISAYYYRAWSSYYQNNYLASIADFNKIIDSNPNAQAYYGRGTSKAALDDYYGAISDYNKSIELDSKYSMVYNNRAWAKYELKKYSEALIDVTRAIELDAMNVTAIDSRADIRLALKDYFGAIEDCNKALIIDPKLANAYFVRAKAKLVLGKKADACEDFSKAGELGIAEAYNFIKLNCNK